MNTRLIGVGLIAVALLLSFKTDTEEVTVLKFSVPAPTQQLQVAATPITISMSAYPEDSYELGKAYAALADQIRRNKHLTNTVQFRRFHGDTLSLLYKGTDLFAKHKIKQQIDNVIIAGTDLEDANNMLVAKVLTDKDRQQLADALDAIAWAFLEAAKGEHGTQA
jgi:hypothetical protein